MYLMESPIKREVSFWSVALAAHALLLLWKGSAFIPQEQWDPIVDVDIVQELSPREQPFNEQLGALKGDGRDGGSPGLMNRMKKILGFSDSKKEAAEPKKQEELMMGDVNKKITSAVAAPEPAKASLVDKSGGAQKAFRVDNLAKQQADLQNLQSDAPQARLASGGPAGAPPDGNEGKLVNKNYRVSAGDLPFQVAKANDGDLLVGGPGGDAPVISVGKKTDRGVRTVSTEFVPGGTGGGGTGTGPGSGPGNGLSGASFSGSGIATPQRTAATGLSGGSGGGVGGGGGLIGSGRGGGSSGGQGGTGRFFSGNGTAEGGYGRGTAEDGVGAGALSGGGGGGGGTGTGRGAGSGSGTGKGLFELTGPLSSRAILYHKIPPYPDWAAEKGIIAAVSLHFFVLSSGEVKDEIVVQRTSGYPALDNLAMESLKQWRFAPLPASQYGKEQWGVITFRFRAR